MRLRLPRAIRNRVSDSKWTGTRGLTWPSTFAQPGLPNVSYDLTSIFAPTSPLSHVGMLWGYRLTPSRMPEYVFKSLYYTHNITWLL